MLTRGRADIGAVVTFTGICRGDEAGAPLVAMTLEHHPGMAEAEIARHAEAAEQRWPLLGVTVVHRYGRLEPGENIVLVVTAAAHRQEAFAAELVADVDEPARHAVGVSHVEMMCQHPDPQGLALGARRVER